MATTLRRRKLSFRDRLGRLTHYTACQLLGPEGADLIRTGAGRFTVNLPEDVYLGGDLFRVRIADPEVPGGVAVATITLVSPKDKNLHLHCDRCDTTCVHLGAAFSVVLEDKLVLGLSAVPDEEVPLEHLTEKELIQRALAERQQRANTEKMTVRSMNRDEPWTDYTVTSHVSGKTYRVALRGDAPGQSYCSCPDFRTNHLGTCKHILHVFDKVKMRFSERRLSRPYQRKNISLRVDYGDPVGLRFNLPSPLPDDVAKVIAPYQREVMQDASQAVNRIGKLQRLGHDVHIYPDAEELIEQQLRLAGFQRLADEIRHDPAGHPLRRTLLKVELLPYQLDGIAFAVGAGRAVLADDMGLGKTIQGIGVAELLAQLADIRRVLVICPATLKSQWRGEIHRACDRPSQLIAGGSEARASQYMQDEFFTICNYEQVLRDVDTIEQVPWDLIILDEGQRIKNWQAKTSRVIKGLKSPFALVLSGTPLENRLDELYTVVSFIDAQRLGPAYRFFHRHRVVDEKGKVLGYKNLDQLRQNLGPILLRRTRAQVMQQLPERMTELIRIRPTQEQISLHTDFMRVVNLVVRKKYLTEMDLLRLQKALLMCRMVADSTFLIQKQEPEYSSKLERLHELLESMAAEDDRKIILFSEWTTMLSRIERILDQLKMQYVRLDGSVPQRHRPKIVHEFQTNPACKLIAMTNAGSTGLNLQAANTVINVDLPWNPAVLEQRISRAHRMGQRRTVQVYLLVTEETIEEKLLSTLSAKQDLALAALDAESTVNEVELAGGMEELKRRLELLLGKQQLAPVDVSQQRHVEEETRRIAERRERVAAAGGQLLGAAFELIGQLIGTDDAAPAEPEIVGRVRDGLARCVDRDESGRPRLSLTLPDDQALEQLAATLARLLVQK